MKSCKVTVLYNEPVLALAHPDSGAEAGVVAAGLAIVEELRRQGLDATPLAAGPPVSRLVAELDATRPDVVFNLIEGFAGRSGGEACVTALLELLGLRHTGCSFEAQALCLDKAKTKRILTGFGLPTAPFRDLAAGDPLPDEVSPETPWFVKPTREDASLGIDQDSVVIDNASLHAKISDIRSRYGSSVLLEAYLPGSEYQVGLLELGSIEPLAIAEVVYDRSSGLWPILTYAAKWSEGSAEDLASPVCCPAEVDQELADRLLDLAVRAFRATGCRDLARVDFRLDSQAAPMILEVNPNPDLDPKAGWARALKASGKDYGKTLAQLVIKARK